MLNIARKLDVSLVEGPGKRSVIWFQGCLKRCLGCCNVSYLPVRKASFQTEEDVIAWIGENRRKHNIEGVTFLGGEPVLQAKGLLPVVSWCQEEDISTMLFTGYTEEEIDDLNIPFASALLDMCDVVVSGPYVREMPEEQRNWVGSSNQKFTYNSNRYDSSIEISKCDEPAAEIVISGDQVHLQGYPLLKLHVEHLCRFRTDVG